MPPFTRGQGAVIICEIPYSRNVKLKIFRSYRTSDADDAEHFLAHYRQFRHVCYVDSYKTVRLITRGQGVVLRRIGRRGHFRSRHKHGGQTIRPAVAENPLLYANFTALYSTEPELLPIDFFLLCESRKFRVFCENNGWNI